MPDPQFPLNPFIRNYIWKQDDSFSVGINDDFNQTRTCTSPDGTTFVTHDRRTSSNAGVAPATTNVSVLVNTLGGGYQIDVTDLTIPLNSEIINDVITTPGVDYVRWAPVHELMASLPATGLILQGATNFPMSDYYSDISPAAVEMDPSLLTTDLKLEWSLSPTVEELEVVIKSEDYQKWLPKGNLQDQNTAGDVLSLKAVLQTKDGSAPAVSRATQFKFELLNVSAEPGVCLNYPNESPTAEPDLKFEADQNADLIITNKGAGAFTLDGEYLGAEAGVSSFDFGAYGELKVTAQVNGKEIVGYFELDPEKKKQPLLLPRRQPQSKIADQWKEDNDVTGLADNDDSENKPVGDKHTGDGLSLYEEYRGFSEDNQHLRTNPKEKDLFICDGIQSEISSTGISIFSSASELAVHSKLRPGELHSTGEGGQVDSWINFNHTDNVPHIVDQHGVILLLSQVSTGVSASSGPFGGTPAASGPIFMDPAFASDDEWAAAKNGGTPDIAKAVFGIGSTAHEIAHVCAVWHHGDTDEKAVPWTGIRIPQPDGTVTLGAQERGQEITEKSEDGTLENPPLLGDAYIGVSGGQHSGDDTCFMRYATAWAYRSSSDLRVRYVVDEFKGTRLCTSGSGAGVNDAETHTPQSRYGNATNGRGNCKSQICVNDKYNGNGDHQR